MFSKFSEIEVFRRKFIGKKEVRKDIEAVRASMRCLYTKNQLQRDCVEGYMVYIENVNNFRRANFINSYSNSYESI